MAVVIRNVPPGYNWGWFSREDTRMHLQVVDEKHKRAGYKVWLETHGRRAFDPAGEIPSKVLQPLRAEVERALPSVEARWVNMMIKKHWLRLVFHNPIITLVAYPDMPIRFERVIDLRDHLAHEFAARIQPQDVALNSEFAAVAVYATKHESEQMHIEIPPVLWGRG